MAFVVLSSDTFAFLPRDEKLISLWRDARLLATRSSSPRYRFAQKSGKEMRISQTGLKHGVTEVYREWQSGDAQEDGRDLLKKEIPRAHNGETDFWTES